MCSDEHEFVDNIMKCDDDMVQSWVLMMTTGLAMGTLNKRRGSMMSHGKHSSVSAGKPSQPVVHGNRRTMRRAASTMVPRMRSITEKGGKK